MDITADKLVKSYINIRNKRQQLLAQFEEEDNTLKQQQDMISERLLEMCRDIGADSLKTQFGTVSKSIKTRYWSSDWGSMWDFIKEHEAFQLMEQRIHQTNMKQFLEENPTIHPMGLNSDSKYTISVRKAR